MRKISLVAPFLAGALFVSSCSKFNDNLAPANQAQTFIKYYGHVYSQQAADVQVLPEDAGYVLLGSTSSYVETANRGDYNNLYLVKTDALGNEIWSHSFGKTSSGNQSYDVSAEKLVAMPDGGFVLAGNCQLIETVNGQRLRKQKRIFLVQVDKNGVETSRSFLPDDFATDKSFEVRDIKLLPDGEQFALTGTTTDIFQGKPAPNPTTDLSDVYIARLQGIDAFIWQFRYGFNGNDVGMFVEPRSSSFVVAGRTEVATSNGLRQNYHVICFQPNTGGILNQVSFSGPSGADIFASDACYNPTTEQLTIVGNKATGLGANAINGELVIMNINVPSNAAGNTITQVGNPIITNGSSSKAGVGSEAASVLLLPNNKGYIITSTSTRIQGINTEAHLLKFDRNMNLEWDWLFGTGGTMDKAARALPLLNADSTDFSGYVLTGTFDLGTNTTIGLVKTSAGGELDK